MITRISDPGLPYSEQPSVLQTLHLQAAFFGFSTLQFWKVVTTRIKVVREVLCVGFFSRLFRSFVLLVGLSSVCLFTSFQMVLRSLQGGLGLRTLQPWSMTAWSITFKSSCPKHLGPLCYAERVEPLWQNIQTPVTGGRLLRIRITTSILTVLVLL